MVLYLEGVGYSMQGEEEDLSQVEVVFLMQEGLVVLYPAAAGC